MYQHDKVNELRNFLVNRNETIAVAESVTSGHLQAALSLGEQSSQYFQGGITVYNLGQKTRHLNIEPIYAGQVNCIAPQIALDLAREVSKKFLSNFGIGITGYATMVPECEQEGLFAYLAITYKQQTVLEQKLTSTKTIMLDAQTDYANQAIGLLVGWLQQNPQVIAR